MKRAVAAFIGGLLTGGLVVSLIDRVPLVALGAWIAGRKRQNSQPLQAALQSQAAGGTSS